MPNSRKTLKETPQFKWALWCPLVSTLIVVIVIIFTSKLQWRVDYVGINNLLDYFKVPLYIASLAFPLVALVATNHRSEQSKRQIEEAIKQNKNSLKPAVGVDWFRSIPKFTVDLTNKGAGVAKIEEFQYIYDGENISVEQLNDLVAVDIDKENLDQGIGHFNSGEYFAKDETLTLVKFDLENELHKQNPSIYGQFFEIIKRLEVKVVYSSLHDEKQTFLFSFNI